MSNIKDRLTMYRIERANKKNKKKLDKMGSSINQEKKDNNLKKINDKLKKVARSMQNIIKGAKKSVRRSLRSDDLLKDAKMIFKEYYEDYKDLTLDSLKKFLEICERYDVIPSDRFDYEFYRRVFETIRLSFKEKELTPERIKMFSRKIFNDLKQTGEGKSGSIGGAVMDPFSAFSQLFLKVTLFLRPLMEELSSDDYSLSQIRNIKDEMQHTVFKKFGMVDLTRLKSVEYRDECKERLSQFGKEISLLATEHNEGERKLGNSDSLIRLRTLITKFAD